MSEKPDIRGYVNPPVPGIAASTQAASMTGEVYTEDRSGSVVDAFIRSIRKGSVVELYELVCLAPAAGRPGKRRRIMIERVEAIRQKRGIIVERGTGLRATRSGYLPPAMLAHAIDQIATTGRARKRPKEGRPPKWPRSGPEYDGYGDVWRSRKYRTDDERVGGIERRFGHSPSPSWLRRHFDSPHEVDE